MRAAVDVGTNTVRLLLGEITDGTLRPGHYLRSITRLGGGFHPAKGLAPEAMERTLVALQTFAGAIAEKSPAAVSAVGTEVLRRAGNGTEFARRVQQVTGLPLRIIDGETEARLTAEGVFCALDPVPESCLVFDIGGGSTEFILVRKGAIRFHRSYPLGVVSLCEETGGRDRQEAAIISVLGQLAEDLEGLQLLGEVLAQGCLLVGTAGTVTSLGALHLGMEEYDWRRINNLVLAREVVLTWEKRLEGVSERQREALPGMEPGRGDLILPGTRIVRQLLERFRKQQLTVSDFGLLEGLLAVDAGAGKLTFPRY